MPSQITNYKCPACTGPLHFAGTSGRLECDYCGSSFSVEEIEQLYAEEEKKARKAMADAQAEEAKEAEQAKKEEQAREAESDPEGDAPAREQAPGQEDQWDHSDINRDWGRDEEKMRAYICPSCCAELICDENTAATSCPYCGNPTVVPGKFAGSLKPDYILPFKLTQEQAEQTLKKHYKGKRLLPKYFAQENRIKEVKGVYVPFWMFDGHADADISFDATTSETHTSGDYRVTNTRHYRVRRAGKVEFEKIPVDASSKMPDDYMDAIEPFRYEDLKSFSTAYLPGFLADKYDVDTEDCAARAELRMNNSAVEQMQSDVNGYDSVVATRKDVQLHKGKVHYAMLPVYMLNTRWKDNTYLFAMNGQTGKMVSKLPISWGRFWAWFAGISVSVTAVLGTVLYLTL